MFERRELPFKACRELVERFRFGFRVRGCSADKGRSNDCTGETNEVSQSEGAVVAYENLLAPERHLAAAAA
jgi:hypothetical protein